MARTMDPKRFGFHSSTRVEKTAKNAYALVIRRKSRIVMKDGHNILAKAEKIRSVFPGASVSVKTCAPVCSKTRTFLMEKGIPVHPLEDP